MAKEDVNVVRLDTQPAQTSVNELRKRLKELRSTLLSTKEGTKEYNSALREAAEIQHSLSEQSQTIKQSAKDFGQVVSNVSGVMGGMVAGFQAAKASMSLFGIENEEVIKSLQKMQSLMAMTQALPALDKAIHAFKGLTTQIAAATGATSKFGKALVATGLGAVVAALGYIVTHLDEISKWLDEITGETDFLGNTWDKVYGGIQAGLAGGIQLLKAFGTAIVNYVTTPFKSIVSAIKAYSETQGNFGDKLKAAVSAMNGEWKQSFNEVKDSFKQVGDKAANAYLEGVKKSYKDRHKLSKEEIERIKKEVEDAQKELLKLQESMHLWDKSDLEKDLIALDKAEKDALKTIENANKKKLLSDEEYQKQKTAIEKHYQKERDKSVKEHSEKEAAKAVDDSVKYMETQIKIEENKLKLQYNKGEIDLLQYNNRRKELMKNYYQDYIDNLQFFLDTETNLSEEKLAEVLEKINAANDAMNKIDELSSTGIQKKTKDEEKSEEEKKVETIQDTVRALSDDLTAVADNPAWGQVINNLLSIGDIYNDLNKKQKDFGKGSIEAQQAATNAYLQIASVGFSAMSQMFNGLAAEQDTSNKKGFETAKKMQIASATMTTLSSVLQALAAGNSMASQMGLAAPVGWALGAAMATMVGTLGALNISKIAKQKFGEKQSTSTSSVSVPSSSAVSSVTAPVQYTQDVQGASIEGAIKDSKVYVVESDISDTQKKVNVTETEATF